MSEADTTVINNTTVIKEAPPPEVTKTLSIMTVLWDWFDQRDVEKHLVAIFTLALTFVTVRWSMHYADVNQARNGTDIGLIIAAINVPMTALQAAVIKWYFGARTGE
jgi:hypothetical protein